MDTQTPTDSDREAAREWIEKHYNSRVNWKKPAEQGFLAGLAAARPTWTGTPPTEPGLYWWTNPNYDYPPTMQRASLVRVRMQDCEASKFHGRLVCDEPFTKFVEEHSGIWAGPVLPPPIPTPAEPTV